MRQLTVSEELKQFPSGMEVKSQQRNHAMVGPSDVRMDELFH